MSSYNEPRIDEGTSSDFSYKKVEKIIGGKAFFMTSSGTVSTKGCAIPKNMSLAVGDHALIYQPQFLIVQAY